MAIEAPQYRPAASPVSTVGAAAPVFQAPQPVQAPRAPEPIMLQSNMPNPAQPADSSFIDSLNAFGSSVGRLGAMLQQKYEKDSKDAEAQAEATMASMSTDDAMSYADKVKLDNKNKALVDGTMTAFGNILSNRLATDPALATMNAAQASQYIKGKTAEYQQRFNSPAFDKTFGPAANELVRRFDNQNLIDQNKAYKDTYVQSIIAQAQEYRPTIMNLPADQQTKLIQDYVDMVGDKVAKDGTLDKSDLNNVYLGIAGVMAQAGDTLGVKAVITKKRGDNPALIDFSPEAQNLLQVSQERNIKINEAHVADVVTSLDLDAKNGTLSSNPYWKMGSKTLVEQFGLSGDKIAALADANQDVGRATAFVRNTDYVQKIYTDVENGITTNLPTPSDPKARQIWKPEEIADLWKKADEAKAAQFKQRSAAAATQYVEATKQDLGAKLSLMPGSAWTSLGDVKVAVPGSGEVKTITADDLKDTALASAFQRIDNDPKYQNDPGAGASAKVGYMISTNYIPTQVSNSIKLGADTTTSAALVEQNPQQAKQAFSAQLQGLGYFRAFAQQNGLAALRSKIGDDAVSFYSDVNTVSTLYTGGDDVAALKYLAAARNQDKDIIQNGLNKLALPDMKDKIQSDAVGPVASASSGTPLVPFTGYTFKDGSFITNQVNRLATASIRNGLSPDVAVDAATRLVANSYTSYKGLAVPRTGDTTYADVQDYFIKKLEEANPLAVKANGNLALVPLNATGDVGQSGVNVLRSTDTGQIVATLKPVTFTLRDGSTFTISNPNYVGVQDLQRIKDAMQYDTERGAFDKRKIMEEQEKLQMQVPVPMTF